MHITSHFRFSRRVLVRHLLIQLIGVLLLEGLFFASTTFREQRFSEYASDGLADKVRSPTLIYTVERSNSSLPPDFSPSRFLDNTFLSYLDSVYGIRSGLLKNITQGRGKITGGQVTFTLLPFSQYIDLYDTRDYYVVNEQAPLEGPRTGRTVSDAILKDYNFLSSVGDILINSDKENNAIYNLFEGGVTFEVKKKLVVRDTHELFVALERMEKMDKLPSPDFQKIPGWTISYEHDLERSFELYLTFERETDIGIHYYVIAPVVALSIGMFIAFSNFHQDEKRRIRLYKLTGLDTSEYIQLVGFMFVNSSTLLVISWHLYQKQIDIALMLLIPVILNASLYGKEFQMNLTDLIFLVVGVTVLGIIFGASLVMSQGGIIIQLLVSVTAAVIVATISRSIVISTASSLRKREWRRRMRAVSFISIVLILMFGNALLFSNFEVNNAERVHRIKEDGFPCSSIGTCVKLEVYSVKYLNHSVKLIVTDMEEFLKVMRQNQLQDPQWEVRYEPNIAIVSWNSTKGLAWKIGIKRYINVELSDRSSKILISPKAHSTYLPGFRLPEFWVITDRPDQDLGKPDEVREISANQFLLAEHIVNYLVPKRLQLLQTTVILYFILAGFVVAFLYQREVESILDEYRQLKLSIHQLQGSRNFVTEFRVSVMVDFILPLLVGSISTVLILMGRESELGIRFQGIPDYAGRSVLLAVLQSVLWIMPVLWWMRRWFRD